MTTSEIISKIFDGTCMLFLGSGVSFGATNSNPKNYNDCLVLENSGIPCPYEEDL